MTETLADLPPSAKYVYDVLERDGPLKRSELKERTNLAERTLSRALKTLETGGYIVKTREPGDLREVVADTATTRTYNLSQ